MSKAYKGSCVRFWGDILVVDVGSVVSLDCCDGE